MPQKSRPDRSTKSAIVSVRLDPKLKYLAELAARKQRRPLSSYIEWAVDESLRRVHLKEQEYNPFSDETDPPVSVEDAEKAHNLWDPDEPDRLIKLALYFPDLLNHEEAVLWKLIRECGWLWLGKPDSSGEWRWEVKESDMAWSRVREKWDLLKAVAAGERSADELPKASNLRKSSGGDFDDEVPF